MKKIVIRNLVFIVIFIICLLSSNYFISRTEALDTSSYGITDLELDLCSARYYYTAGGDVEYICYLYPSSTANIATTSVNQFAVRKFTYGADGVTISAWARDTNGRISFTFAADDRATLTYK